MVRELYAFESDPSVGRKLNLGRSETLCFCWTVVIVEELTLAFQRCD